MEAQALDLQAKRKHQSFSDFNVILQQCPSDHLKIWIQERIKNYRM